MFSRKERDAGSDISEIEKIMEKQGCSEPVARNLIKYAKLGIGPLVDPDKRNEELDPGYVPKDNRVYPNPPKIDRRTAALEFEMRLREREEQDERDNEARRRQQQGAPAKQASGLSRLGPVIGRVEPDPAAASSASGAFEQPNRGKDDDFLQGAARQAQPKKKMQFAGIKSLGPVETRLEEVDPLRRDEPPAPSVPDLPEEPPEEEDRLGETRQEKMKRLLQQDKDNKPRNKKRRRRGKEADDKSEGSDREADGAREESPQPGAPPGGLLSMKHANADRSKASASGSLMSEAQVMAMMKKDRNTEKKKGGESSRGSIRAKTRIQKEMQEWERAKANNPEFWKAPQFALCYSAETGKLRGMS